MPKFLENILRRQAAKAGITGRRADRYVFGRLNRIGAMHGNKITAKGAAMDAKHRRDVNAGVAESPQRHTRTGQFRTRGRTRTWGSHDWSVHE